MWSRRTLASLIEELIYSDRGSERAQPIRLDKQGLPGGSTRLGLRWAAFRTVGGPNVMLSGLYNEGRMLATHVLQSVLLEVNLIEG